MAGYRQPPQPNPIVEFHSEELPKPTPTPTPTEARDIETPLPPLPVPPVPIPMPPQPDITRDVHDDPRPMPNPLPNPGPTSQPEPPRPSPSPAFTSRGAAPSNDKARWITNDDYPARALRDGSEGTVGYRLIVGSNGRVSACEITRSSGHSLLDETSCRLIERRARFDAATDQTGAKVVGGYSGTVTWQIPD